MTKFVCLCVHACIVLFGSSRYDLVTVSKAEEVWVVRLSALNISSPSLVPSSGVGVGRSAGGGRGLQGGGDGHYLVGL